MSKEIIVKVDMKFAGTGYFGNPKTGRSTKVHLVIQNKPICGAKVSEGMEYQWCAQNAFYEYLSCDKCKKMWQDNQKALEAKAMKLGGMESLPTREDKILAHNMLKLVRDHRKTCKGMECNISLHLVKKVLEKANLLKYLEKEDEKEFI